MRAHLEALLVALLAISGLAHAAGIDSVLEERSEVALAPSLDAVHVEASIAAPAVSAPAADAAPAAAPAVRLPAVVMHSSGRTPAQAHPVNATWGENGTMRTDEPETLRAEAELSATTPLSAETTRLIGLDHVPLHARVIARGDGILHAPLAHQRRIDDPGAFATRDETPSLPEAIHHARAESPGKTAPEGWTPLRSDLPPWRVAPIPLHAEAYVADAHVRSHEWPPAVQAAAAVAGIALLLLVPWALYHHVRGKSLLEQGTRARLHALLRERPGLPQAQLARELAIDGKTLRYHLHRLRREGLVVLEEGRPFLAGAAASSERAALVAAHDARRVLQMVLASPGQSKTTLAGLLGVARATACWHLDRLQRAGLVRFERAGRHTLVHPQEAARAVLERAAGASAAST